MEKMESYPVNLGRVSAKRDLDLASSGREERGTVTLGRIHSHVQLLGDAYMALDIYTEKGLELVP
jgi:hypothetical protein